MDKVEWKDVEGYEGLYEVSNTGLLRSIKTNRLIKPFKDGNGMYMVDLYGGTNEGKGFTTHYKAKRRKFHRLIGETFVPNPLGLRFLVHADGDKENWNADNLVWSSNSRGEGN